MDHSKPETRQIELSDILNWLPPARPTDGNKRSFGKLQIVAGSPTYPGAARLCALGAFKSGCGYLLLETEAPLEVLQKLPEVIPGFDLRCDAFVIGPGLDSRWTTERLATMADEISPSAPLLIDGTALDHLESFNLPSRKNVALTPHEGELARILGGDWSAERIRKNRTLALQEFSKRFPKAAILLKGSPSIIYCQGEWWELTFGSVAMANAGQGDLLSGVIGAYLALGMPTGRAVMLGASLCALAATCLTKDREPQGVLAHEVGEEIPALIARIRSGTQPTLR